MRNIFIAGLIVLLLSTQMFAQSKYNENQFGMCSYLQYKAKNKGWDWVSYCAEQMQELGIKWDRGSGFIWEWMEPEKGEWELGFFHNIILLLKENDIEPVITLGPGTPKWASNAPPGYSDDYSTYPPAKLSDWAEYIYKVVSLSGYGEGGAHLIRHWEIWNEPDLSKFYGGSIERLARLTNIAYKVIKMVDPEAVVISPGFCGFSHKDNGYVDKYLSYNPKFDIYNMHSFSEYGYLDEIENSKKILAKHNRTEPIWMTETNLKLHGEENEQLLIQAIPRRVKNILDAGVEKVFWFQLVDGRAGAWNNWKYSHTGILREDGSRKDVFYVIQKHLLSRVISGQK